MRTQTPLRYPGGKASLSPFLQSLVRANGLRRATYAEPYCGGAGAAINLLFAEAVDEIELNDLDPAVHAFWWSVLNANDDLCDLVAGAELTAEEWDAQRQIYRSRRTSKLSRGFAFFYLNRVNRSGILNGGLIGGRAQTGKWKMDARFNRDDLVDRIAKLGEYKDRIQVHNEDALTFLKTRFAKVSANALVYLDPPYFNKGQCLYKNSYAPADHAAIAAYLRKSKLRHWVVSYDATPEVLKLYSGFRQIKYGIQYSARDNYMGKEVMIFSDGMDLPADVKQFFAARAN